MVQSLYSSEFVKNDIKVIGISQFNTTESASIEFVNRHNITFPNIYDPEGRVADGYGVTGIPTYIFIDKWGNIASRSSGAKGTELIHTRLNNLLME